MEQKKKIKGITLVALVVTIVVLLILAGITLVYVFGDNSILKQATDAKIQTEIGKIEEKAQIIYSDKLLKSLSTKVETSEVISQLILEGYTIEKRAITEEDIEEISLDKENITMGKQDTVEIYLTYKGVEELFIYYVEVNGKYYRMYSNKGFITVDRKASNLTKVDFETDGDESATTLKITNTDTNIITAKLKEGSNNTIVITSTKKEGEATITAVFGTLSSKPCKIKVIEPILATKITLNETEYVVTGGESWTEDLQLIAKLEPSNVTEKEVNWKSSDSDIATVDDKGLVKAGTKGGIAEITAVTKDGTNLKATCKITTELFGKINESQIDYTDSDGNTAQIPDGFAIGTSENVNKISKGLVIQDNEGSQFVWVPVGDVKVDNKVSFNVELGRYAFFANQPIPDVPVESADFKINNAYYEKMTADLQAFIDNSKEDGGYWFARFSCSNDLNPRMHFGLELRQDFRYNEHTGVAGRYGTIHAKGVWKCNSVNSYAWDTALIFVEKAGNTGYATDGTPRYPNSIGPKYSR